MAFVGRRVEGSVGVIDSVDGILPAMDKGPLVHELS